MTDKEEMRMLLAAFAMQGLLSFDNDWSSGPLAAKAFAIADAMIQESEKKV